MWINIDPVTRRKFVCEAGKHPMKRSLIALGLAGSLAIATIATPTDAHARWGRGRTWGWGFGAFALGAVVGAALARPYYARSYYYPAYYGYAYPAYPYAGYYGVPYGGSWRGPAGYY